MMSGLDDIYTNLRCDPALISIDGELITSLKIRVKVLEITK